jgi:NADPH:quinone reductase
MIPLIIITTTILSGAYVVGTARHARNEALVREAGADEVIVGDDISPARAYGPYHLIIDSVGGKTLATALSLLATGATCLTLGWSASPEVTIDIRELIRTGGTTLYGLNFMEELNHHGGSKDLAWLAQMVAKQQLKTSIEVEASWHEISKSSITSPSHLHSELQEAVKSFTNYIFRMWTSRIIVLILY